MLVSSLLHLMERRLVIVEKRPLLESVTGGTRVLKELPRDFVLLPIQWCHVLTQAGFTRIEAALDHAEGAVAPLVVIVCEDLPLLVRLRLVETPELHRLQPPILLLHELLLSPDVLAAAAEAALFGVERASPNLLFICVLKGAGFELAVQVC